MSLVDFKASWVQLTTTLVLTLLLAKWMYWMKGQRQRRFTKTLNELGGQNHSAIPAKYYPKLPSPTGSDQQPSLAQRQTDIPKQDPEPDQLNPASAYASLVNLD